MNTRDFGYHAYEMLSRVILIMALYDTCGITCVVLRTKISDSTHLPDTTAHINKCELCYATYCNIMFQPFRQS